MLDETCKNRIAQRQAMLLYKMPRCALFSDECGKAKASALKYVYIHILVRFEVSMKNKIKKLISFY